LKNIRINTARFFAFIVAVQVLNLCIDTQTFQPIQAKHTVGYFNEINSFVEYFAEVVLDHKNAMPEYQKSSHESQQLHKHFPTNHLAVNEKKPFLHPFQTDNILLSVVQEKYNYLYYKKINPPPPKA